MRFSLDTNAVIDLMANRHGMRLKMKGLAQGEAGMSSIVLHELLWGAYSSARPAENHERIARLNLPELDFDREDARVAAEIRANLRRKGTPIGPYDLLIAGQALARGLTLVTANTAEFARVEGLRVEDWR
jgi:tRNA(fMet)-specific endonuclease VapC